MLAKQAQRVASRLSAVGAKQLHEDHGGAGFFYGDIRRIDSAPAAIKPRSAGSFSLSLCNFGAVSAQRGESVRPPLESLLY